MKTYRVEPDNCFEAYDPESDRPVTLHIYRNWPRDSDLPRMGDGTSLPVEVVREAPEGDHQIYLPWRGIYGLDRVMGEAASVSFAGCCTPWHDACITFSRTHIDNGFEGMDGLLMDDGMTKTVVPFYLEDDLIASLRRVCGERMQDALDDDTLSENERDEAIDLLGLVVRI